MNRKTSIFKRVISLALVVVMAFLMPTLRAYAIYGYGYDEGDVLDGFIEQYGWDQAKMAAYSWVGDDGTTYTRQSSYERSLYDDIRRTNEELAVTLGLISGRTASQSNANGMVELAIAEWKAGIRENPMGSNNVKYNTWYYGRTVSGDDYPWCCVFISWLADQCGLIKAGVYAKTAGCAAMQRHFISRGYDHWELKMSTPFGGPKAPVPGDIIIWGNASHIALVVAVNGDSIETIEGNSGDRVSHNTYTKSNLRGDLGNAEVFHVSNMR